MNKKIILRLFVLLISVLILPISTSSCTRNTIYSEGNGDLNVLCTSFAPFDFARNVCGDAATVSILQDSGSDLHNYTPTTATLDAIANADLFIYVGGISDENWIHDAIKASGNEDLTLICLMDFVEPVYAELENDWSDHSHGEHEHIHNEHGHEGHDHGADEHIWTSPRNAISLVNAICDVLCSIDSKNSVLYKENSASYIEKLSELDKIMSDLTSDSPTAPLIFADRFPFVYLMHDYHIPYKAAFSGCSTEINSSVNTHASLIEAVRANNSSAIIIIEGSGKDLAEAIANETGCGIIKLNSMQSVTREDIVSGASYLDFMKENVEALKEVLE